MRLPTASARKLLASIPSVVLETAKVHADRAQTLTCDRTLIEGAVADLDRLGRELTEAEEAVTAIAAETDRLRSLALTSAGIAH